MIISYHPHFIGLSQANQVAVAVVYINVIARMWTLLSGLT